nr:unnamed protein product [Spirometra erinaceieuropaei]
MRSHSDKLNPLEIRHLHYISQFTTDIRHIDSSRNEVADALSRPSIAHLQLSSGIDLNEMAAKQRRVGSPSDEDVSGLQLPLLGVPSLEFLGHLFDSHGIRPLPSKVVAIRVFPLHTSKRQLQRLLGYTRIRTTAYYPAANGMVERFHRQLKTALRVADNPEGNWTDDLPLVMLGMRSPLQSDLDCSAAAEIVFGATVRLPGQIISPTPRVAVEDPTNLLHRLRRILRTLSPLPSRHQQFLQRHYSPPSVQPGDTVAVRVFLPSAFTTLLYCPPHAPRRYAVGRDLTLLAWEPFNDRMENVRLMDHFTKISIVSEYALNSAVELCDNEEFQSQLQALVERLLLRDLLIVAGDWNDRNGPEDFPNSYLIGRFVFASRCENGVRLLKFADQNRLLVNRSSPQVIMFFAVWMAHGTEHVLILTKLKVYLSSAPQMSPPRRLDVA